MSSRLLAAAVLVIALPLDPGPALADPGAASSRFPGVSPRKEVKVHTKDGHEYRGVVERSGTDSVQLYGVGTFHAEEVDRMWLRGRATKEGALFFGIVVGGLATYGGYRFCEAMDEQDGPCSDVPGVLLFGLLAAGAGALAGASIGSFAPAWHEVDLPRGPRADLGLVAPGVFGARLDVPIGEP